MAKKRDTGNQPKSKRKAAEANGESQDTAAAELEAPKNGERQDWYEGDDAEELDASFKDYEITATPNDFNVKTICDFVDSGAVKIPAFQRNYVWDIKRASKLVESILIGLPIPQIFLYEEKRNSFLVIDGQQRLMSIYYFVKQRFPRRAKRPELRRIFADRGGIPPEVFENDEYYVKFNLQLPSATPGQFSRFHRQNYSTLGDYQTTFNLRTIRNIIIKQVSPPDDADSSIFEIFNRLNTQGVNLRGQEIRASLYHSDFMTMLEKVNLNPVWRKFLQLPEPDLHAKDSEILLRAFATLARGAEYKEPMSRFLNAFAKAGKSYSRDQIEYAQRLFEAFFAAVSHLPEGIFSVRGSRRFNIAVFEAVFRAACEEAFARRTLDVSAVTAAALRGLKADRQFLNATRYGTGRASLLQMRYERARAIL